MSGRGKTPHVDWASYEDCVTCHRPTGRPCRDIWPVTTPSASSHAHEGRRRRPLYGYFDDHEDGEYTLRYTLRLDLTVRQLTELTRVLTNVEHDLTRDQATLNEAGRARLEDVRDTLARVHTCGRVGIAAARRGEVVGSTDA